MGTIGIVVGWRGNPPPPWWEPIDHSLLFLNIFVITLKGSINEQKMSEKISIYSTTKFKTGNL